MLVRGLSGTFANQSFMLNGTMVFGRAASSCHVLFPDNTQGISRMHCKIDQVGNNITITDLGSSYGTYVNGLRIPQHIATPLKAGDNFYLGDQMHMFTLQEGDEEKAARMAPPVPQGPVITPEIQPISPWGYVGYLLLFAIPIVGLVMMFVFAFGGTNNINVKNLAKGNLWLLLISVAICIVVWLIILGTVGSFAGMFGRMMFSYL